MVLGAKKRVRVYTTPAAGDQTIEGILVSKKPEIVLELADLILSENKKQQLQGRVHVLREHVRFWQVIS